MDSSIQRWLNNIDELKKTKEKLNKLREEQNQLESEIINNIQNNNLENNIIKVGNKKIKLKRYKSYSNITNQYLFNIFTQVMDKDNSSLLLEYIRENRPYKVMNELKLIEE
jgi:hypothetical protein